MRTPAMVFIGMVLSGLSVSGLQVPGLPVATAAEPGEAVSESSGQAVDGLRLSLSILRKDEAGSPVLQLAFENVGRRDITLNLGMLLANGKPLHGTALHPTNVRLHLTSVAGTTRELHYMAPNVAGRVDDFVVPLRIGSTYTLTVPLSQFWCPATNEVPLKLHPGEVQLSARFEGSGAAHESGKFILNYWAGAVRSNAVALKP
jgi:hypothetical protein